MKKIIYSLTIFSLVLSMTPALAAFDYDPKIIIKKHDELNTATPTSETAPATATVVAKPVKYTRRSVVAQGVLKEIKAMTAPTELVVTVNSITPKKNKKWVGAYPAKATDLTVKVDAKTKVVRKYNGKSDLTELTAGDKVQVTGKTNEDGTVTATLVKDDSISNTLRVYAGKIESLDVTNSTFVLPQGKTKVTVKIDTKTKLIVPDMATPTFVDLQVGDKVHVRGIINAKTKYLTASLVRVSPDMPVKEVKPAAPVVTAPATPEESIAYIGTAQSKTDKSFVMKSGDKTYTVNVGLNTHVYQDVTLMSLIVLKSGDTVRVHGALSGDTITATEVDIIPYVPGINY